MLEKSISAVTGVSVAIMITQLRTRLSTPTLTRDGSVRAVTLRAQKRRHRHVDLVRRITRARILVEHAPKKTRTQ